MPYKDREAQNAFARRRRFELKMGSPAKPNVRKGENIVCANCNKEFYRSPADRLKRGTNEYCSRVCMSQAFEGRMLGDKSPRWKGRVTKFCEACGKEIARPGWAWVKTEHPFCNSKCFAKWKSENWTEVNNPAWKGGHPTYYGPTWERQAREIRRRDSHECQFCGKREFETRRALDVHHIVPFRLFGLERYKEANRSNNLITLCEQCHTFLEKFSESGDVTEWLVLKRLGLANQKVSFVD